MLTLQRLTDTKNIDIVASFIIPYSVLLCSIAARCACCALNRCHSARRTTDVSSGEGDANEAWLQHGVDLPPEVLPRGC